MLLTALQVSQIGLVKTTKGYNLVSAPAQDRSYFTVKLFGLSQRSTRPVDVQEWEFTTADMPLWSAPVLLGFPLGYATKVLTEKFS